MPATSKAQQAVMAIADHDPSKLYKKNQGVLDMSHQQLHDFASTPTTGLPKRKFYGEDGGDGKWIQHMTNSPNFREGALTKKADAAGMAPMAFARKHYGDSGRTGRQARAAVNMQK
jgi:hypothetical protein